MIIFYDGACFPLQALNYAYCLCKINVATSFDKKSDASKING